MDGAPGRSSKPWGITSPRADGPEGLPQEGAEGAPPGEEGSVLEEALQRYLELRLFKRPPEGLAGAGRKAKAWAREEAQARGEELAADWEFQLDRGFLEVEGDVSEAVARRRHERRRYADLPRSPRKEG